MDPNDILKHGLEIVKNAPDIAKTTAAVIGAFKLTEITKAMLGPAANEFAERIHDEVRLYRFGNQLKLLKKAEKMAQDAGFKPQAVPPKILFPLLEGASFEDNEDLHTMWAALLANAASPENAETVRPGFIAILRQMSADEAKLLNWMSDRQGSDSFVGFFKLADAYLQLGFPKEHLGLCLNGLEASRLLDGYEDLSLDRRHGTDEIHQSGIGTYSITDRGREFIRACRPPKPKA